MSFKRWIIIAICLFSIGMVTGLALPINTADLLSEELAYLKELADFLEPFQITTAVFIFLKNVSAVLISFVFSPMLCLLPILALTFNGLLLSLVSTMVVQEESVGVLMAGLLPHGIFEIPALIIGEAAALSFGTMVMIALFKKEARGRLSTNLKQNSKYLLLAATLLVPAAIIETFITPLLLI